jgi:hypothetical protein
MRRRVNRARLAGSVAACVFEVREHEMDNPTDRHNTLDGPGLSELDDRLDGLADRLESGTAFWFLWLFHPRLPTLAPED